MTTIARTALLCAGFFSLGLGAIGAVLPLLPTTPFLLVAAFCFARSSERFHEMIMSNRWSGPYLRNYHERRPMTKSQLRGTIATLWISLVVTAVVVRTWWMTMILLGVAIGVATFLVIRNRQLQRERDSAP